MYIQRGSEIFLGIQGANLRTSHVSFLCVCVRARVRMRACVFMTSPTSPPYPHIPCVSFCVCARACVSLCEIPYASFSPAHRTPSANMARRPGDHSFRQVTDLRIAAVSALQKKKYVSLSFYLSIFYLYINSMAVVRALDDIYVSLSLTFFIFYPFIYI